MTDRSVIRHLAAVLVADAVGYSRLMATDELATHRQFKADLADILLPKIGELRGRLVKTTGDGLVAEFASVVDAVKCAADAQRRLAERNARVPEERRLAYRMGINLGDIIVEENDIYGDDVNVAARLEGLAEPGGINVSANVYRYARGKADVEFDDLGEHRLKNIADPMRIYRVRLSPAGGNAATARSGADAVAPLVNSGALQATAAFNRPAIVVLPIENLGRDPEQEYFCDGLTSDITTDLSKFSNLLVIAANSAFNYKGKRVKVQDVGRDLGVRYVLEGSVQRAGSEIRINAQLIDAALGHHIWAERYRRPLSDLFALQEEMIQRIVGALAIKVNAAERERAVRGLPGSVNAYDAFLKGVHLYSNESREALDASRLWFETATRLDPNYGRAWGELAYVHVQAWLAGWAEAAQLTKAKEMAAQAVALDPYDYYNHWNLAFVCLNAGNFAQALDEYERAMALNRNDADLLVEMAEAMIYAGRCHDGIAQIRRAMVINPHVPDWYRWTLAWGHYHARAYDDARSELDRMVRLPHYCRLLLAAIHVRMGDGPGAAAAMTEFLRHRREWTVAKERQAGHFLNPADEAHWIDGVRAAGLPE